MKDVTTLFYTLLWWVLFIFIVAVPLLIMWKRGKKDLVKQIVYYLVCQAEQQFGSGTGEAKLAMVLSGLYNMMPWPLRIMFPQAVLRKYIEDSVHLLEKQLQGNNKFNLMTYDQEVAMQSTRAVPAVGSSFDRYDTSAESGQGRGSTGSP